MTGSGELWPRVRDTFVAPARLAARLRKDAPWLDVLLISTAVAMIGVLGMPDEIFTESMRDAVSRRGEPVEITSPPEDIARWGRAIAMLATLATHPVTAFVLAGMLTLAFAILGGGRGTYREYLSLSAHALLIPALGSLVTLIIRLALPGAMPGGIADTLLRPDETESLLVATAATLDPFLLWMMVVLGVGVHVLDRRFTRFGAAAILVSAYFLLVLASAYLLNPHVR
jgi:hypothetical protein